MSTDRRAEIHAALGDPGRLAIIDELTATDRAPSELVERLGISPSLLSFHLDTLERAGLVRRLASAADRRRKYIQLNHEQLDAIQVRHGRFDGPVVFVCTHNSARSQLAAALWTAGHGTATSAGIDPAESVHAGAISAARRAGLDLGGARPRRFSADDLDRHVITVCDRAHEVLRGTAGHWHWSIPDPVEDGTDVAFDRALALIRTRIDTLTPQEAS